MKHDLTSIFSIFPKLNDRILFQVRPVYIRLFPNHTFPSIISSQLLYSIEPISLKMLNFIWKIFFRPFNNFWIPQRISLWNGWVKYVNFLFSMQKLSIAANNSWLLSKEMVLSQQSSGTSSPPKCIYSSINNSDISEI